jgi:hypothetical protein
LDPPPLEPDAVGQPNDLARDQSRSEGQNPGAQTNQQREETRHQIEQLQHSTRGSRYRELRNLIEFARMHEALLKEFGDTGERRCLKSIGTKILFIIIYLLFIYLFIFLFNNVIFFFKFLFNCHCCCCFRCCCRLIRQLFSS